MNLKLIVSIKRHFSKRYNKDGTYAININKYGNIRLIGLLVRLKIGNKYIKEKFFRMLAFDLITCEYFYIGFVVFMLNDKRLTIFLY